MQQLPKRLVSIDVLRAITMLLMIFVNDVDGVSNIPGWIGHAEGRADALGFADTIFPAFLFIVGLSLPFAIKSRLKSGKSFFNILVYILTRSAALLIMGFYIVNMDDYNSKASIISKPLWAILATLAFFLIWLDYPETLVKVKKYLLMGTGVVLLIFLAVIYHGGRGDDLHGMDPSWWGILGLIGWAYLVCALVYLLSKGKLWVLLTALVTFFAVNICRHIHVLHDGLWFIEDASTEALVMGGIVITEVYALLVSRSKTRLLWVVLSVTGVLAIVLGLWIRPYAGGISKIYSTPAWILICSGITILVFELLVYLVDVKGKKDWFKWIAPAGTSTLTCYLIPYFQYFICRLCHINYPDAINDGVGGLLRSALTALLIVLLVGLMEKKSLRLKI
jgi:heparan-alpha-glucosaminide N-acetyltransferase